MAKSVKVNIITKETIKPSSPTPQHNRLINLSLFDQLNFAMSTPVILFYPSLKNVKKINIQKQQSEKLKLSLSEALNIFYPLAGHVVNNSFVECNDYGIDYVEAKIDCTISEIFEQPDHDLLSKLIHVELNSVLTGAIIQVNFFSCGGLAIGVSLSHKITDAASLVIFLMNWAAKSLSVASTSSLIPHFVADTIIPSLKDPLILPPPPSLRMPKCKTNRFVFMASKVSALKAKAASVHVQNPTRVEAVTAFIWKCLMNITKSKQSELFARESVVIQAVNLRKRFVTPLPHNFVGNLSGKFLAKTKVGNDLELSNLVSLLRQGLDRVSEDIANLGQTATNFGGILKFAKDFGEMHNKDNVDLYTFTSLCGFPFYEIDFGWGNPKWAIATNLVLKNYIVMIDTKDGKGIEVWMSLGEEDMDLFERNEELLEFACINPSVSYGDIKAHPSCL
ncbi:BAHD acyltransferase BIA1-like [Mercurialis annua]|uniref:BAHD acyltransferase BIA1-like n=1 Tax=Mercurialis annua TaxID=3986 RepID=UPI00215ED3CA|nr:BAHD acyltransferase BIA1-like [Mercurialis annua]